MTQEQTPPQGFPLNVSDVVFILFRHKWKIVIFVLLGVLAAAGIWFKKQPLFESQAKVLVRYVAESRALGPALGQDDVVREPDVRGVAVLNSEVEILTSLNCAVAVVRAIGAQRFLAGFGGGTNEYQAAGVLLKNLTPKVGNAGGVIWIKLAHPDPLIAREALEVLIQEYLRHHVEVHLKIGGYDLLQSKTDQLKARLIETEQRLSEVKAKANVISLDQSKLEITTQLSALRTAIYEGEAELAERKAELSEYEKVQGLRVGREKNGEETATNAAATSEITAETLDTYNTLSQKLALLKKKEAELLSGFYSETSKAVTQVREQITETTRDLSALGFDRRKLPAPPSLDAALPGQPPFDVNGARARLLALEARITQLKSQRTEIQNQAKVIEASENTILELQRQKELDEGKLRHFEATLDKARFDQAIDFTKITNISVIEEPTPAGRDMKKFYKLVLMAFGAMAAAGLGLAFVIDMFIDDSMKRPKDVEQKARIPLFATIPNFAVNGHSRKRRQLANGDNSLVVRGEVAPWDASDPMLDHYEALRDRLVMSYSGDLHKPKIVGLTSCSHGAGTTRIATGLAAALSRDVQRRVLFIGLEKRKVSATAFYKGRPVSELLSEGDSAEANNELLGQDLQGLVTTGKRADGASIVQSFCDLIPRLQASDYDYIIFDLPPLAETSGAVRLAGQMEHTVIVVEAEKTAKRKLERAKAMLSGSGTRLSAILNKQKEYGPGFLFEE